MKYQMTMLEEDIEALYKEMGIFSASDLDMYYIASELDIWIHFWEQKSEMKCVNGLYSILLNEHLSRQEQWQDFGHETGHIIKHVGKQHELKKMFRDLQESQANNFMFQFCVPTFMLLNYQINEYANFEDGVHFISENFNVTEQFSRIRLNHFKNQLLLAKSDAEHRAYMRARYQKAGPYSKETQDVLEKLNFLITRRRGAIK